MWTPLCFAGPGCMGCSMCEGNEMSRDEMEADHRERSSKKTAEALKNGKPSLTFNLGDQIRKQLASKPSKK